MDVWIKTRKILYWSITPLFTWLIFYLVIFIGNYLVIYFFDVVFFRLLFFIKYILIQAQPNREIIKLVATKDII